MKLEPIPIGKYLVGEVEESERAGKKHLIFKCQNCPYGKSIADDKACRFHVLAFALQQTTPDIIILYDLYERVYDENQTKLLVELADLLQRFKTYGFDSIKYLVDSEKESTDLKGARWGVIESITADIPRYDPITAFLMLSQELKKETNRVGELKNASQTYGVAYLNTLRTIYGFYKETDLIKDLSEYLKQLSRVPPINELYKKYFEAQLKPSFIASTLMFPEDEQLEIKDSYYVKGANVQIFKHPNLAEHLYYVNAPEYSFNAEKFLLWSQAREIVGAYTPGKDSVSLEGRSRKYYERRYESVIAKLAQEQGIALDPLELRELAIVVARYTVGYGILEILLSDRETIREELPEEEKTKLGKIFEAKEKQLKKKSKGDEDVELSEEDLGPKGIIQDIYLDAPVGKKPIYLNHSEFGICKTNILYSENDAKKLATKIRTISGRPLDETHPVLDYDLKDFDSRVAIIQEPLSPEGLAFAFRLHALNPWTISKFLDPANGMLNPLAAGFLSFFVSVNSTILVCGSRGSGKTSLLGALMLELDQDTRLIVQEDSVAGDSFIVVERNGQLEKTTVGELIDELIEKYGAEKSSEREILHANPEGVRVFSLNKDNKTELKPVSQFMRHKVSKELFEVKTRSGKKIKVTGDHSLFTLKNNSVQAIKTRDIIPGSFIASPRFLPLNNSEVKSINLFEKLMELEQGFIVGEELKKFIEMNWSEIKKIAFEIGYKKAAVSAWKRKCILPISVLKKLDFSLLDSKKLSFKLDRKSKEIPVEIVLSKEFLNFIGLWLADGSFDSKYAVIISTSGCENLIQRVAEQFGLKARKHSDSFSSIISNTGLNWLLKNFLDLNGNAYTKKIPKWVFNLSKNQIAEVLKGIFSGDDYTSKYEVGISLVSKNLIQGIEFFLLAFGVLSRKRFVERDKTFNLRISGIKNIQKFKQEIGFLLEYKTSQLDLICSRISTHDVTDVIPFSLEEKTLMQNVFTEFNSHDYISRNYSIGRQKFQSLVSTNLSSKEFFEKLKNLAFSDIFWDEVESVKSLGVSNEFVYDFSVPGSENFVCENIVAHNTLELPVEFMKDLNYNVQSLKTRSPLSVSVSETEVAPEEALRTSLRLGDSAIILGEVRSKEAKVLYEAMRVGAAGSTVMGTIHADSAYAVWDRVVHDLEVPTTSFKATDLVIVAKPFRHKLSKKRVRRIAQITEVKKHWNEDPEKEGGLLDLMSYNAKEDELELLEDNVKDSDLFKKVSKETGMSYDEIWDEINSRGEFKKFLPELNNLYNSSEAGKELGLTKEQKKFILDLKSRFASINPMPKSDFLLEAKFTVAAHNKYLVLREEQLSINRGKIDYSQLLVDWKDWVIKNLLEQAIKERIVVEREKHKM